MSAPRPTLSPAPLHTDSSGFNPPTWSLIAAVIVLIDLKIVFALTLPGPWYVPDEVIYLRQARSLHLSHDLFSTLFAGGVQPLWPMLLAPIVSSSGDRWHLAYLLSVFLASALSVVTAIPFYHLARRWLDRGTASLASLLLIALPGPCLYGWAALSEPLFMLILYSCALAFVRA